MAKTVDFCPFVIFVRLTGPSLSSASAQLEWNYFEASERKRDRRLFPGRVTDLRVNNVIIIIVVITGMCVTILSASWGLYGDHNDWEWWKLYIKEDGHVGQWWCQWGGEIYFLLLTDWVTRISWFILLSWVQQTWVWITNIYSLHHSWSRSILAAVNETFSDFEQQDHFYTIIHFPLHHCLMLTDCQSLAGKLRAGQWTVRQLMVVPSQQYQG